MRYIMAQRGVVLPADADRADQFGARFYGEQFGHRRRGRDRFEVDQLHLRIAAESEQRFHRMVAVALDRLGHGLKAYHRADALMARDPPRLRQFVQRTARGSAWYSEPYG